MTCVTEAAWDYSIDGAACMGCGRDLVPGQVAFVHHHPFPSECPREGAGQDLVPGQDYDVGAMGRKRWPVLAVASSLRGASFWHYPHHAGGCCGEVALTGHRLAAEAPR